MKARALTSVLLLCAMSLLGQVGLGTTTPHASFDVKIANPAAPGSSDGMLIPRVNAFSSTNPAVEQHGMIVFLTATAGIRTRGFYFWDNTLLDWVKLSTSGDERWLDNITYLYPAAGAPMDVAIGTTSANDDAKLTVLSQEKQYGIYNQLNWQDDFGEAYALYNFVNNPSGNNFGVYNNFTQENPLQVGVHNEMTYAIGQKIGTRNIISSSDMVIGTHNFMTGENARGLFNEMIISNGAAYGAFSEMGIGSNATGYGYYTRFNGTDAGDIFGTYTFMNSHSNSNHYGNYNFFEDYGTGQHYGQYNFFNSPSALTTGVYNNLMETGSEATGVRNDITSGSVAYGVYNNIYDTEGAWAYGTYNFMTGIVDNIVGTSTQIFDTNNSLVYGSRVDIQGGGTNFKYGYYSIIDQMAGGTHYGVYSQALKSGSFAGYFVGDVQIIGTPIVGSSPNEYRLPTSDGSVGQTLQTDGAGQVSWSGGNVKAYTTTGTATGVFFLDANHYTVRIFNDVGAVMLPSASTNTGRIYILIGSNGIAPKGLLTSGEIVYDDVTNSFINTISANQRFMIQSDGTDWIVIGR